MENPDTPPEEIKETVIPQDSVAQALADEVKKHTGNGNGSANGHHKEKTGSFSLFDDLEKETAQDKQQEQRKKDGYSEPSGEKKNPFGEYDPDRDDVKAEELKDAETITLEEANARVALYLAGVDFLVSQGACLIRNDYSLTSQLKYRMHPWRKKAIQLPWVKYVMLPKKRSNPAWALCGAIVIGVLPIFGMAAVDRMHEEKIKNNPEYAEKTKNEPKFKHRPDPAPGSKTYRDPFDPTNVVDVEFVEVKDETETQQQQEQQQEQPAKSKVGRHAKTCPKHLDSESKDPCNCK